MHKPRLAIPLDMTELLLEGSERRQRHTHLRLQQVELASFTLRDGKIVTYDMTSEKSAPLWMTSDFRPICGIGPVVGIGLVVGSILVVNLT